MYVLIKISSRELSLLYIYLRTILYVYVSDTHIFSHIFT